MPIVTFVFLEHTITKASMPKVPKADGHRSIHDETIITFVFLEHTTTKASMPRPQ